MEQTKFFNFFILYSHILVFSTQSGLELQIHEIMTRMKVMKESKVSSESNSSNS